MIATVLWRMAGSPVVSDALPFADVADETWYTESVRWASMAYFCAWCYLVLFPLTHHNIL